MIIGETWMHPGESRKVGFYFPSWDRGARELGQVPFFYIREGNRVIGEARAVNFSN
jgi:hypothetical protein